MAAAYLVGRYGEAIERDIAVAEARGLELLVRELEVALEFMRQAAQEHAAASKATSPSGSGEVPQVLEESQSEHLLGPWVGSREAADEIGVSVRQVRNLVTSGHLSAASVGGRLMITVRSLEDEKLRRHTSGRP